MTNIVPLSEKSQDGDLPPKVEAGRRAADPVMAAIKTLFDSLPRDKQRALLKEITSESRAIPTPRAGVVLDAMAKVLPLRSNWTTTEIKEAVAEQVEAEPKDVYNALGYLTRRGYVRRLGYGRYLVDGGALISAENLGEEPSRYDNDDGG